MKRLIPKSGKPFQSRGEKLRAARKEAGLTQEGLSKLTGIHRQWLGRWERNRSVPSAAEWQCLADSLHLDFSNVGDVA
jgi:transcriptional regulator with XRE-family HTH domain